MWYRMATGAVAGAVGTMALNATTYLDMALRGRQASGMPAQVAGILAEKAGVNLGDSDTAENRRSGIGALLGYVTGVGFGVLYGAARPAIVALPLPARAAIVGLGAMASTDLPATGMGVTDPAQWDVQSWAMDVVPHLLFGLATVAAYDAITGD